MNVKTPYFDTFESSMLHLDARGIMRMNPSLENINRVLHAMHLQRPRYFITQVVGTNGKGSTSSMLSSICTAHGYKTGLFTSPHFITPRERIRINGESISEQDWLKHANLIMQFQGDILSYFELVMAIALSYFNEEGVNVAVMEAGLGGTWDATSAIASDLTVITPIALDHCSVLGNSIEEVAKDKSGAIRSNVPVCSASQKDEAWHVIKETASHKNAPLSSCNDLVLPKEIEQEPMYLSGDYQKTNRKLAVLAWQELSNQITDGQYLNKQNTQTSFEKVHTAKEKISLVPNEQPLFEKFSPEEKKIIAKGLSQAWIPGRMQQVPACPENTCLSLPNNYWPPLMLDGAHNEHGMKALGESLAKKGIAPLAIIFSCLEDKEPEKLIPHLRALSTGPIFVPPIKDNPRALSPEALAKQIGLNAVPVSSLDQALCMAITHMRDRMPEVFLDNDKQHPLLICGSLYLLGEFFCLRPELLTIPQQPTSNEAM